MASGFNLFLVSTVLIFLWMTPSKVQGSNILVVPFVGEGSHFFVMTSITKELASRGHNITILVHNNYKEKLTAEGAGHPYNFAFFDSDMTLADFKDYCKGMTAAGLEGRFLQHMIELLWSDFMDRQLAECRQIFENKQLMSQLQNSDFQLALVDPEFQCPLVQYLHKTINLPFIGVLAVPNILGAGLLEHRSPLNPSYIPEFTTGYDEVMSFGERLTNTATSLVLIVFMALFVNPYDEVKIEYGFPDASNLYGGHELFMMNTHFALDFPRPLLPNQIAVGGLTTRTSKPLDNSWEEFLQNAGEEGVVLFSMGSYATDINDEVAAMFGGAFAQLPQKVIWKLNGKPSTNLTTNVKVVDWVPQNDLLGHPQIKVFVYHCGINGVWEAVYHGVPMVAIPLFGDQHDNAQRVVSRGMGVKVDITTLTSDQLAQAIRTVISDKSYKENAMRVSAIFRDTPRDPPELAADWVEHVLRHGDAKHLRSAALDLNVFQYLLLDVILTMLVMCATITILIICSCKLCIRGCRKLCGRSYKVKHE